MSEGVAHVNIPITIFDDNVDESSETVVLSLNEGRGYTLGSPVEHSRTIIDNDETSMQVALSVSPDSVAEDAGATVVTVTGTLDAASRTSDTVVTVSVGASSDSATERTDYGTVDDFALTIDAGATSGTATFTLTPEGDSVDEDDETLSVTGMTSTQLSVAGTTATIVDDDETSIQVALSVSPDSVAEDAGATVVTVTGTLDAAPRTSDTVVTVSVGASSDSATEGTDYGTVDDFALTIDAGATSGTATFTLTPEGDSVDEDDETLSVTGTTSTQLSVAGTTAAIVDDDETSMQVALSVSPDSVAEDAGATVVTVTGTLDAAPRTSDTVVTVSVGASSDSATEGTDYGTVDDFALTIDAGATSGTATFTLTPEGDSVDEDDETLSVTGTTSTQLSVTGTTATIMDDDTHVVELSVSALSVPEGGSSTYTVVLTGAPGHDVTVTPSSDNADVTFSPARLRFDSNNPWDVPQAVTVSAARDDDTADDVATITHEVSGLGETDGGLVTVTVEPGIVEEQEKAALTETIATIAATAVSNVTTNIGTRFFRGSRGSKPFGGWTVHRAVEAVGKCALEFTLEQRRLLSSTHFGRLVTLNGVPNRPWCCGRRTSAGSNAVDRMGAGRSAIFQQQPGSGIWL